MSLAQVGRPATLERIDRFLNGHPALRPACTIRLQVLRSRGAVAGVIRQVRSLHRPPPGRLRSRRFARAMPLVAPEGVHFMLRACYIDHMRSRLRLFLLCLLIVSLPIQSIAGVARLACGMTHHQSTVDSREHGMTTPVMMIDGAMHDSGHEHSDSMAQSPLPAEDCEASVTDTDARSSCGTCSGCSIGAYAPPPVIVLTAGEEPASQLRQFSSSPFTGHIPARIERPPRTSTPIAA
jgi:hypothetical protein